MHHYHYALDPLSTAVSTNIQIAASQAYYISAGRAFLVEDVFIYYGGGANHQLPAQAITMGGAQEDRWQVMLSHL